MKKLLLVTVAALILLILIFTFASSAETTVRIEPTVRVVGMETPVKVHVENPHGIRKLTAYIEQNGTRHQVYEQSRPAARVLISRHEPPRELAFVAGKKQVPALQEGKAKLVVEAVSNDLRAATTWASTDVDVNTRPLTLAVDSAQHYINQGGSELVTFTVSGPWTEAGVRVGNHTFRSFAMPGESDPNSPRRFALFAFSWDTPATTIPVVYARGAGGNEVTGTFWFKVFPKQFRKRDLEVNDQFLQKVVTQIDPNGSGDLIQRFLRINRDMRQQNNKALSDLRLKTEPRILWNGPFYRLGKVESFFADERTYIYKGQKIDRQMHLGFDLSDVQGAPVKAANSGRVVHAEPLGIYGNCIVVDHGYGLQSIYGHLREISVKAGDLVQKEQVMGRSGDTGLAGGDHLHYSMQVDGVQVQPIEWWDDHWIQDRVLSKLPGAHATYAQAK